MTLLQKLQDRGLIHSVTEPHPDLDKESFTFYAGFDPTADSLHVGHLFVLMMMLRLAEAGHTPIAVVGGATGMIGDPSGKSQERVLMDATSIARNVEAIREQIEKFLPAGKTVMLNNLDWTKPWNVIDFLRDIGKNFRLSEMLAKESVQKRLNSDEGISFTEFTYQILQSYDFLHLCEHHNCILQIGGSDQWGNITAGKDLIRKRLGRSAHGITFPLVQGPGGGKFGKTEQGAVWLSSERTSPYEFYQFFLKTEDAQAPTYLRYFTLISDEEISRLETCIVEAPEKREAQKALAFDITSRVHGQEEAQKAVKASEVLFGQSIEGLSDRDLLGIFQDVPSKTYSRSQLNDGLNLLDVLVETGLISSRKQARQRISQGGIYLNNERVSDENLVLKAEHLASETTMILRAGKRQYFLIRFES